MVGVRLKAQGGKLVCLGGEVGGKRSPMGKEPLHCFATLAASALPPACQDKKARKAKIHLYRNKETGALKGDGTVSYEDPFSAGSAVSWFHQKEFKGEAWVERRGLREA